MTSTNKICLIGDIVVDVTLKSKNNDIKLRLGGIIHAARCLWALNIPYTVAYFAPAYLDKNITNFLTSLNCTEIIKLGNIIGAPYAFLIEEAKEVGDQGYEFLLRDHIEIEYNNENYNLLLSKKMDNYLLISGNYDWISICNNLTGRIHVDIANNIKNIEEINSLNKTLNTIFISTSSDIFKNHYKDSFTEFSKLFANYSKQLILKENRGGSRGIEFTSNHIFSAPSQTQPIIHSIGVGDVYCAAFVSYAHKYSFHETMVLSSWIAAEYATTTYPDDFRKNVERIIKSPITDLIQLGGTLLPWESRNKINIYIAAPDFDYIDTTHIDKLVESLKYHNFSPRRPIKENGQLESNTSKALRQETFSKDMQLLDKCDILIAVILYDDPGTYIELGIASNKGIPTFVYDPLQKATNCILTELPTLISPDLDEIISSLFITSAKLSI